VVRARLEIGKLQRHLWQRQKRLISRSVLEAGAPFRAYEANYLRRVRGFSREASYAELLDQVAQAGVVYVGDYHTLKQSQRSFLKLVQRRKPVRPLLLALEFVQGRHQPAVDAYLEGRLSEERFLRAIEYGRHAVFETWPHFKPIFDEARARKLPIIAVDLLGKSLAARDEYAARRIGQAADAHPGAQIFVLAGQLHIAPPHLPSAVSRRAPDLKPLVVYQNCERIWWSLQRDNRELEVEACLVRAGEYCLINTPPVVVQQSYLDWIEGGVEPLDGAHPEARFRFLARTIARFLGLDTRAFREALSHVSVYTAGDLSFLDTLPVSARERKQIEQQILSRESYYIPRARIAYLANLSVNHAAEEAAHFVRNIVSGAGGEPRGLSDAFYARALEEAYAFCGSKIVNPRRKCPHEAEFERMLRGGDAFTRQVARYVLAHRAVETGARTRGAHRLSKRGPALFNAVTHSLGYILGERLYYGLATGVCSKSYVRELFVDPLEEEGEAFAMYMMLSRRLASVRIPKRV
jgi:uncharacterized iron-regulated protein